MFFTYKTFIKACSDVLTPVQVDEYIKKYDKVAIRVAKHAAQEAGVLDDLDDLVSQSRFILFRAARVFDPDKNPNFELFFVNLAMRELAARAKSIQTKQNRAVSLEKPVGNSDDGESKVLGDYLESGDFTRDQEVREAKEIVKEILADIDPLGRYVLVHKFGLNGEKTMTNAEIAKAKGISVTGVISVFNRVKALMGSRAARYGFSSSVTSHISSKCLALSTLCHTAYLTGIQALPNAVSSSRFSVKHLSNDSFPNAVITTTLGQELLPISVGDEVDISGDLLTPSCIQVVSDFTNKFAYALRSILAAFSYTKEIQCSSLSRTLQAYSDTLLDVSQNCHDSECYEFYLYLRYLPRLFATCVNSEEYHIDDDAFNCAGLSKGNEIAHSLNKVFSVPSIEWFFDKILQVKNCVSQNKEAAQVLSLTPNQFIDLWESFVNSAKHQSSAIEVLSSSISKVDPRILSKSSALNIFQSSLASEQSWAEDLLLSINSLES